MSRAFWTGLAIAGAVLVERNREAAEKGEGDPMDLYGVAKLFERAGDTTRSAALLEQALADVLGLGVGKAKGPNAEGNGRAV